MIETDVVEDAALTTQKDEAFSQLADLQMAFVGGGVGTVLWG